MRSESRNYDALVVGAGTAGSWAATCLARQGLKVGLVEARRLDEAGARWVNGVPLWMYDEAGVPRPEAPELRPSGRFTIRVAGSDAPRAIIEDAPVEAIDVRHLSARLHGYAREAGVEIWTSARLRHVDVDLSNRVRWLLLDGERSGEGAPRELLARARLFVDASGLGGALRRHAPDLARACPKPSREETCSAAQAVYGLGDRGRAQAWLETEGLRPLDTDCRLGGAGGYSTDNVCVDLEHGEVEFLTGVIADGHHGDGPSLLQRRRESLDFVGERHFGGSGAIPVRRPYDQLAGNGVALVGNAACQVFAAHGSGTGIGLVAARILAERVTRHADPGGREALWDYQARFMRRWGGLLAAYDLVRSFSHGLDPEETAALLGGILPIESQVDALDQRLPSLAPGIMARSAVALARSPRRAKRLAEGLGAMPILAAHYRAYPRQARGLRLRAWAQAAARLRGGRPDPV